MALGVTNDSNYRLIAAALRARTSNILAKWTPAEMPLAIRNLAVRKAVVALYDTDIPENTTLYFKNENTGITTQTRVNSTGATIRALTDYEITNPITMTIRLGYGDVEPTETFTINNDDTREIFFADFRTQEPEPEPEPLPDGYTAVPSVKVGTANKGGIIGMQLTIPCNTIYKIDVIAKCENSPTSSAAANYLQVRYGTNNFAKMQFNPTTNTDHKPYFTITSNNASPNKRAASYNEYHKYSLQLTSGACALTVDDLMTSVTANATGTTANAAILDLFTIGTNVTSQVSISDVKFYNVNGDIIEWVRPCTRDSDGVIGMYAMTAGVFSGNTISGGELIIGE